MSRDLLLTSLTSFYTNNPEYTATVASIISGGSKLSLRILDWFVTHYARTTHVIYYLNVTDHTFVETYPKHNGGPHIRKFNLYLEYRKQLQSYTKMFFDPFRRHDRISFVTCKEPIKVLETTVGQLNFFRWATENHVIEYVLAHLGEIEKHMASTQKEQKRAIMHPQSPASKHKEVPNILIHGPCHVLFN